MLELEGGTAIESAAQAFERRVGKARGAGKDEGRLANV